MTIKKNYLNNRDLLKEIHRSKISYSSYKDKKYQDYDIITDSIKSIDEEFLKRAVEARAERLTLNALINAKDVHANRKMKLDDVRVEPKDVSKHDVVVRVMTWDHIPNSKIPKKTIKTVADSKAKLNFPPYQHWIYNESNQLELVGKSHWKGDLHTGEFSINHGRMTDNLGYMFILISEKYSEKSNWRGYTYVDEMRGQATTQLSQVGLQFNEARGSNAFAYYTSVLNNAFLRIFNNEKKAQEIRDDLLELHGYDPSMTRQLRDSLSEDNSKMADIYKNHRVEKSRRSDYDYGLDDEE